MTEQQPRAPTPKRIGAYFFCSPAIIRAGLQKQGLSLQAPRHRRKLGELLVEAGAVTPTELDAALRSQRVARLQASPLFADLSRTELTALANRFEEVSIGAGEQFIRQGEEDPTLYLLASGRVEVFRLDEQGREIPLATVAPPEPIGEMGYFAGGVRNASIRALEATELLRARYADLTHYFENVPRVAHGFVDVVERRRRATIERMQQRAAEGEAPTARLGHLAGFVDLHAASALEAGMQHSIARLVRAAADVTAADSGWLYLRDPGTGELWTPVRTDGNDDGLRLAAGTGIAGWVAEHDEMVNIIGAYDDPRFDAAVDARTGVRSNTVLCAPVRDADGRVAGVVEVVNKQFGAFTEDDERLLRAFCEQVAVAVANMESFRRAVADHQILTTVLDVATLVSRVPDLPTLSARLGERVAILLGCEHCDLLLADYQADELWSVRRTGGVTETNRYAVAALPAGLAAVKGTIVSIADTGAEAGFDPAANHKLGLTVRNLLAVPVRNRSRHVVGVLQALNKRDGAFTAADESMLQAIAAQTGMSVLINA
ncbi:MAG: GAF domain-containing protein [Gammaproteobacteria bacterium]|nr:GAF domain-containing protein [Gammaproteobacteria bacterium]